MRKRIITRALHTAATEQEWLDLERTASVEITSEDNAFPIEAALLGQDKRGWRAAEPGVQTIRLIFDEPQKLRRVSIVFEETETKRTQEFTLRWSPDRGSSFRGGGFLWFRRDKLLESTRTTAVRLRVSAVEFIPEIQQSV